MIRKRTLSTLVFAVAATAFVSPALAEDNEAKTVLRRAIDAAGGEGALNRLKSPMMWMERGTFYGMGSGNPFVAQYAAKWPNWYRQEIENAFAITANEGRVWVTSEAGNQELKGAQLEERQKQIRVAWAERLFPLTDDAYRLSTIDGLEVDGRPTVGLKASHADGRDVELFFDAETYLIAKIKTMVISPQHGPKPVVSETYFSDHKSFSGVKMPSKYKLYYDKQLFVESETVDYKTGATLDPKQFEGPASSD